MSSYTHSQTVFLLLLLLFFFFFFCYFVFLIIIYFLYFSSYYYSFLIVVLLIFLFLFFCLCHPYSSFTFYSLSRLLLLLFPHLFHFFRSFSFTPFIVLNTFDTNSRLKPDYRTSSLRNHSFYFYKEHNEKEKRKTFEVISRRLPDRPEVSVIVFNPFIIILLIFAHENDSLPYFPRHYE